MKFAAYDRRFASPMGSETSMRDVKETPMGSSSSELASVSDGDIWPIICNAQPGANDLFSLLSPAGRATSTEPIVESPSDPIDVLEQLQREAEDALRDPNHVSTYAIAVAVSAEPASAETVADSLQALADAAQGKDNLLELLDDPASIDGLAEPLESLDVHELFAFSPAADVLQMFAGDIVPTRRQDIAPPLARREHHLVSMDSAFRPAHAQETEHGN